MASQQEQISVSSTDQSTNLTICSNENIIKLLTFDDKFIAAAHSQIYIHPQITSDIIVQFQINYITDLNQMWGAMVSELTEVLVTKKMPYDNILRDYFHKLLSMDYLPLLRINRYQLTQLSLYGFDIYVPPLSALLQITNRIDGLRYSIQNHIKQCDKKQIVNSEQFHYKPRNIWDVLGSGWAQYIYFAGLCKISLNIYLLKQYLKIGAKSLIKKDKQIVFTGCNNIFNALVPLLKQKRQIWLLCQFAELANQLYMFHPSYSYSLFFTLLLPLQNQYQCIFKNCQVIADKCANAYILTPLLFSVLRNYEQFLQFVEEANHQCWGKYLNALAYGLLINFKARILQYEEVLTLFKAIVLKLGLMSQLSIHTQLRGQLDKQWGQARQFFISALKTGYSFGNLQTWHPINQQQIQNQILISTRDSLLMHSNLENELTSFMSDNYQQYLQKQLQQLDSKLTLDQFSSFFNQKIGIHIQATNLSKIAQSILRISNLTKLSKIDKNPYIVSNLFVLLGRIQFDKSPNLLISKRLIETTRYYMQVAFILLNEDSSECLRQALKSNASKFIFEQSDYFSWFQLMMYINNPKQSLSQIFDYLEARTIRQAKTPQKLTEWLAANILAIYRDEKQQNFQINLKTFNKQFNVPKCVINLSNKMHSCFGFLIKQVIFKHSEFALNVLLLICSIQNSYSIPLISFPVSFSYQTEEQQKDNMKRSMIIEDHNSSSQNSGLNKSKLQSFSMWFIKNSQYHKYLKQLMNYCILNNGADNSVSQYAQEISNMTVFQQIVIQINQKLYLLSQIDDTQIYTQILDLIILLNQAIQIRRISTNHQQINKVFYRRLMKLYLRVFDAVQSRIVVVKSNNKKGTISQEKLSQTNKNTIKKLVNSLLGTYFSILSQIFNQSEEKDNNDTKLWLIYMRKICSISLIPPVEGIQKNFYAYLKDYDLPSIKKDSSFLIQSSIDYLKQSKGTNDHKTNSKQCFTTANNIFKQQIGQKTQDKMSGSELNNIQALISLLPQNQQIRTLKIEQLTEKQLTKQFLLPSLSSDTIYVLLEYIYQDSEFMQQKNAENILKVILWIVSLSPSNHFKMIESAISVSTLDNNKQSIINAINLFNEIGLTKQLVNFDGKYLQQILRIAVSGQLCIDNMCSMLDENCKKVISDGFQISSIMNSSDRQKQNSNNQFIRQLLSQKSLYFLLVYNQSNWRNIIDWQCSNLSNSSLTNSSAYGRNNNNSGTSSIPSIILQYLEYIKITKTNNTDYEIKVDSYRKLLCAYSQMLQLKCKYLESLEAQCQHRQQSSLSYNESSSALSQFSNLDKNSSVSEVSRRTKNTLIIETIISQQQIQLYYTNELANIKLLTDCALVRQVLKRISAFKLGLAQIFPSQTTSQQQDKSKYQNINKIYDDCVKNIQSINNCANKIAKGSIIIPDFIRSYNLCSDECYSKSKIKIGQYLQDYYNELGIASKDNIYYMQFSQNVSIVELMETHCSTVNNCLPFPKGTRVYTQTISGPIRQNLTKMYQEIKATLIQANVLTEDKSIIDFFIREEQQIIQQKTQQKNYNDMIAYFGLLHATLVHDRKKLSPLLQQSVNRKALSYDLLKSYHKQNYHYIKSVLVDDQEGLQKSQITFTLKNRQLVQGGKQLKVNLNNRHIYCNEVAKNSLGVQMLKLLQQFTRGYLSLITTNT